VSGALGIELGYIAVRLSRGRENARGSFALRRALSLRVGDARASGAAEAAPLEGFSSEILEDVFEVLRDLELAEGEPLEIAARALPEGPPSARFALEAALLDRAGQREACPVAALLGASAAGPLRSVVLIDSLDSAVDAARLVADAGAPGVKIKIGRTGRIDDEARVLREVRGALGESSLIRVDANGTLGDARHPLFGVLAEVGVDYVEEPFPVERLLEGPALPIPVALDESVPRAPELCLRALERGIATTLVLKPTRHGVSRALALSSAARERGGRAVVGHLFEPPRAFAALVHVALAIAPEEVHGLAPYEGIDRWVGDAGERVEVPPSLMSAGGPFSQLAGLG
jgi:L-alanine-DL-glutamate epimerase-like enolase superfamily enzyme